MSFQPENFDQEPQEPDFTPDYPFGDMTERYDIERDEEEDDDRSEETLGSMDRF